MNLTRADMVADFIPVDTCINLMVAVAWRTAVNPINPMPVKSNFRFDVQKLTLSSRRASAQAVTSKWHLRTTNLMNTDSAAGEIRFLPKNRP